jgi:DNA-directed RNA polymerase II subunit RPB1
MTNKNPISSKIVGIQFSIGSPEEIRNNSVVEITSRDTYINNKPVLGGLFDPRMGVLEPGTICPTDGFTYIDSPGYFGHVELARPVIFTQHLKDIMKIAKCVCYKCSKLLINKDDHKHILNWSPGKRWTYVSKLASKVKRCGNQTEDGCGCKQPDKIKVEEIATIYAIWEKMKTDTDDDKVSVRLTPELLLKNFKRISDEDVHFMGFNPTWSRPDWMICQVLPVPPPQVRPSVKHDAQQRSEDDLTHIYSNIIKTNNDLKEKIHNDAASNVIDSLTRLLQYFIAMIANNKTRGAAPMAQRSGRPFQCIFSRLNGKTGRIRGNLMGKRVNYSARTVITGDPKLGIRELGVPKKVAQNLTKPVKVNDRNREYLNKLVQNGPDIYPGAKTVERNNGESISLRYVDRKSLRLEIGDTVHRSLIDGDMVLFNRQPSLHRMSMMGHIVRVMKKGDTFRMNVADTKPYNADFDGDEMNLHAPQSIQAETELKHLAAIPYQIISPASNSPIIGIYQDSMLGSYRFTRPNLKLNHREAMNLLMMYNNVDVGKLRDAGSSLGSFDILSQIMPPLTLSFKNKMFGDNDDHTTSNNVLEIRNGKIIRGQMEKSVLGSTSKGILHRAYNDFGHVACSDFIDNLQNIITEYMHTSSYSVGISDLIADNVTQQSIVQAITQKKLEVQALIDKVHLGIFENDTADSNAKEFETQVNKILNKAMDESGKIARSSLSSTNRFMMIVESGAKGNMLNITQMISGLGQQNVDGKRIPYGYDNRTLPHFSRYDDSPDARGFVVNSYIEGLNAFELFHHAQGGRVGLIDTACKTSVTGYIQRRLIKHLEDVKVAYDMTVRNNKNKIVQYSYGDDGVETTRVENQPIPLVGLSTEDIYMRYDILGIKTGDTNLDEIYTKDTITRLKRQRADTKQKCSEMIEYMIQKRKDIVEKVFKKKDENMLKLPVSFVNTINNIQGQLSLGKNSITDVTPLECFNLVDEYLNKLKENKLIQPGELFATLYKYYLNPRDLLVHKRFNRKGLIILLETILLKYKKSIVHPGEMVGIIAGQSTGEPTTQMTLNTFHYAGTASKSNVTRGVPRIEELLRLTKNPKNPSLTIHLKKQDETHQSKAIKYSNIIEYTKLQDLVSRAQICFDPDSKSTFIEEDKEFITQFYEYENMVSDCLSIEDKETLSVSDGKTPSKWIVRLEIDSETLLDKNITMDDINYAIQNSSHGSNISCAFSDFNQNKLVFRIRPLIENKKRKGAISLDQSNEIHLLKTLQDTMLNSIVLRGIVNIEKVTPRKLNNMVSIKDGSTYKRNEIWVLDTTGTNLMKALSLDFIDAERTYSNDIREIHSVLGIEAARQALFNEITEVMEFSDSYINYHHLSLLCDRMTMTPDMIPVFRSGILNDDIGPIAKASFEVHSEVLLDAARHAEVDTMRGVSANVMCGQNGNFGTSSFGVVLDMNEMQNLENAEIERNASVDDCVFADNENGSFSKNNIIIRNNIGNIKKSEADNCQDDDDYNMGF